MHERHLGFYCATLALSCCEGRSGLDQSTPGQNIGGSTAVSSVAASGGLLAIGGTRSVSSTAASGERPAMGGAKSTGGNKNSGGSPGTVSTAVASPTGGKSATSSSTSVVSSTATGGTVNAGGTTSVMSLEAIELDGPFQVNNDGTVVVGVVGSNLPDMYAAKWSKSSGLQVLSSDSGSVAWVVSGDGATVFIGSSFPAGSVARWVDGRQYPLGFPNVSLSPTGSYVRTWAGGANITGSVAVGAADYGGGGNDIQAFLWSADSGFDVFSDVNSSATGVSANGAVVAGNRHVGGQGTGFRWTVATRTFEDLEMLPGTVRCDVQALSADGLVSVGFCADSVQADSATAVLWEGTTAKELGGLKASSSTSCCSSAVSVNADGSLIVGNGWAGSWIWDPVHGVQSLISVLTAGGADTNGWTVTFVTAISSDGKTVVGRGTLSNVAKGFIARLR